MKSLCPDDKFVASYFGLLQSNLIGYIKEGEKELEKGLPVTFPYTSWWMAGQYYKKLIDRSYDLERMVRAGASRREIHTMLIKSIGM